MSDSANSLSVRLDVLETHGWVAELPERRFSIAGTDMVHRKCVLCGGLLFGVPRQMFLSVHCGRVMLIGESTDADFDQFLRWLGMKEDPALTRRAVAESTSRQKSLFGTE